MVPERGRVLGRNPKRPLGFPSGNVSAGKAAAWRGSAAAVARSAPRSHPSVASRSRPERLWSPLPQGWGGFLRSAEHRRSSASSFCTQRQLRELTRVISVCVTADIPQGERPGAEARLPCNCSAQLSSENCRCAAVAPSASLTASLRFFDVAAAIFFPIPLFKTVTEINMQQKAPDSGLITCYG